MRGCSVVTATPYFRLRRSIWTSRWSSPSPRMMVCFTSGVVSAGEGGILLVEAAEPGAELVLVAPAGGVDRHGDVRLGEPDRLDDQRPVPASQSVSLVCVSRELGHHAQVTGVEHGHLEALLPLRDGDVGQLLGPVPVRVHHLHPLLHAPAEHAEEGQLAHVGLAHRLVDQGGEGLVVRCPKLHDLVEFGRWAISAGASAGFGMSSTSFRISARVPHVFWGAPQKRGRPRPGPWRPSWPPAPGPGRSRRPPDRPPAASHPSWRSSP
jgi:hypothetical protein